MQNEKSIENSSPSLPFFDKACLGKLIVVQPKANNKVYQEYTLEETDRFAILLTENATSCRVFVLDGIHENGRFAIAKKNEVVGVLNYGIAPIWLVDKIMYFLQQGYTHIDSCGRLLDESQTYTTPRFDYLNSLLDKKISIMDGEPALGFDDWQRKQFEQYYPLQTILQELDQSRKALLAYENIS